MPRIERRVGSEHIGIYIKVTNHGRSFFTELHADGTLSERNVFNDEDLWTGTWRIVIGGKGEHLQLRIGPYDSDLFISDRGWVGHEVTKDPASSGEIHLCPMSFKR